MVAAFYSSVKGQAGTSSNLLAAALFLTLYNQKSVFIVQSHCSPYPLENFLMKKPGNLQKAEILDDYGMDALLRKRKLYTMNEEMLLESSYSFLEGKFHVLPGSRQKNGEILKEWSKEIFDIIHRAAQWFDVVLVDVNAPDKNYEQELLKLADLCVFNLCQNRQILEFAREAAADLNEKCIFLLGKYNARSRYNLNNICFLYPFIAKKRTTYIEYSLSFCEAAWEAGLIRFFRENYNAGKKNKNFSFMNSVKEAADLLLKKAGENPG